MTRTEWWGRGGGGPEKETRRAKITDPWPLALSEVTGVHSPDTCAGLHLSEEPAVLVVQLDGEAVHEVHALRQAVGPQGKPDTTQTTVVGLQQPVLWSPVQAWSHWRSLNNLFSPGVKTVTDPKQPVLWSPVQVWRHRLSHFALSLIVSPRWGKADAENNVHSGLRLMSYQRVMRSIAHADTGFGLYPCLGK